MTGQGRRVEEVCVQGEKPKGIWSGDFQIIFARMCSAIL